MRPTIAGRTSSRDQNILISEYVKEKKFAFTIPVPEMVFPGCYLQLYALCSRAVHGDILIMFSIFQLAEHQERLSLFRHIFTKFSEVHFARENLVVHSLDQFSIIEIHLSTL